MMLKTFMFKYSRWIFILFTIFVFTNMGFSQIDSSSILLRLDSVIAHSDSYTQQRENRINKYKEKLRNTAPHTLAEYELNSILFDEYKPYICDSAIAYQNKNIELASMLKDDVRESDSKIKLAYLLGSVGLYKEAVDLLESVNRLKLPNEMLVDYYNTYLRVYGELSFYTQDKRKSTSYWKVFDVYLDSLKTVVNPDNILFLQLKEDSARNAHQFEEAIRLNDQWLIKTKPGTPEHALVTFRRSLIYQWQGKREEQKYYLALSAISDIQSAIQDQASMMMIAQILYEEGNIDRAYRYIRFSWNATMFYNAKLRSLQSSSILSLIDKTYQAKIENQKEQLQRYLILISSLSVLLLITILIIFKQIRRLSTAKLKLQHANKGLNLLNEELNKLNVELNEVNQVINITNNDLSESNRIKEVYIGRFIELCSVYINNIDNFRKKVHNKIKEGNINDAKLMTQSQDVMDHEFEELYANFDSAFLQLFPDFVEKVNELLNEKDRFIIRDGEPLNPELRIMALMRLGISDGSKISQFLRYSLTTVYNYRTKTKNRTFLQKEEFDNKVLQIR